MERIPTRSSIRTWLLGASLLILLRLLGERVPLVSPEGWLWITRLGEAWLVGGLMLIALAGTPMRDVRAGIGRWRMLALAALVAAVFAGQYVTAGASAYPFVRWDMYTARADATSYGLVLMNMPDGSVRHLPLRDEAWLSTEPRAISERLLALADRAAEGDDEADRVLKTTLGLLVDRSTSPPPESVTLVRCSVTKPVRTTEATCETVTTVEMPA